MYCKLVPLFHCWVNTAAHQFILNELLKNYYSFKHNNSEIIHVCAKPLTLFSTWTVCLYVILNFMWLSLTVRHIPATHPEQQDRREQLVRWAPLRGHRGRRSSAGVCPAPAPGLGAPPAAPWSYPPPLPQREAAATAGPPPPGSPTGGPSCRETGDGRRVGRKYYEEEEERVCWGGRVWVFDSWVTFWKWENTEILCGWSAICGTLH